MMSRLLNVLKKEGLLGVFRRIARRLKVANKKGQINELILNEVFNYSSEDLALNKKVITSFEGTRNRKIKTINWFFIPSVSHPMGGVSTIFRFARYLAEEKGVINNFVLCGETQATESAAAESIALYVPGVTQENIFKVARLDEFEKIPSSDIAIATRWDTALYLLRFNRTKGKFYFIQDFEPLFFPASINYMLAEATYRFGFHGIANSISLYDEYKRYNLSCEYFTPGVDKEIYFPNTNKIGEQAVTRIFFYARPGVPRNGFELGIEALKIIKQKYGSRVQIYTAGQDWDTNNLGLEGVIENLGMFEDMRAVAELYRNCDIGLSFIFTKHPSYQPIEYMASGAAVVTNFNMHTGWLLKNEKNCLLTEPTVQDVTEKLERLIEDPLLREKLIKNGLTEVASMQWDPEWRKIWDFITQG